MAKGMKPKGSGAASTKSAKGMKPSADAPSPAGKMPTAQPQRQPVVLTEEEFDLLDRADFIGHEYLHVRRLRAKGNLSAEEQKSLAEHDALEARIQKDPNAVLEVARSAIDQGTALLLKLIRSKRLRIGYPEHSWDEAVECYASRLSFMNQQLVRISEERAPKACWHLWFEAKELADAVVRLCVAFPDEFRPMAEGSLTMPSLRARRAEFTCDAAAMAKAIHLAEKHAVPDIHDNRSRIGGLCHHLVARLVEEVERARREREHFEREAEYRHSAELLPPQMHAEHREHYTESWKLPDLRGHAEAWWKGRVREMVRREFERMKRNPLRNPALWRELEAVTAQGTESAKRHALEKYCSNKMKQIAGEAAPA